MLQFFARCHNQYGLLGRLPRTSSSQCENSAADEMLALNNSGDPLLPVNNDRAFQIPWDDLFRTDYSTPDAFGFSSEYAGVAHRRPIRGVLIPLISGISNPLSLGAPLSDFLRRVGVSVG